MQYLLLIYANEAEMVKRTTLPSRTTFVRAEAPE